MLAHDASVMFGVSSNSDSVEFSMESLRGLLTQVELELQQSEVYRRAVETLEDNAPEGNSAQFLLKAVSREAIRLALRQVMHQAASTEKPKPVEATPQVVAPVRRNKKSIEQSQAEEQEYRQACLRRLGEQVRKAREARSMSLSELHSKTFVPLHQLQAIEAGHGLHLPEDIYLRGFIVRIAKALNIDSAPLLEILPTPDPVKSILPSWYRPSQRNAIGFGGVALQPMHLYLGYAALMAGGFVWLSHQTAPQMRSADLPQVDSTKKQAESNQSGGVSVSIAPPERF